jgi:hypothetical protein
MLQMVQMMNEQDHALNHLDSGIRDAVLLLRENGIETIESCQGGNGHAYPEPTVRFAGGIKACVASP